MKLYTNQLGPFRLNRVLQIIVLMSVCWTYKGIRVGATTCDCGVDCVSNCTAGQYWDNGSCTDCHAGHYCPGVQNCPPGVSCIFPCPIGTYTANLRSRSEDECVLCPPGSYCQTPGLSWPTGDCDPGWFCTIGAQSAQPATAGEGGRCSPGEFCPRGSSEATPCTPGMYCNNHGLAEPTGSCSAGYYCLLGARYPDPYDGDTGTGHICPRGYFCPEGSSYTIACPPGTFSNVYGNREVVDCNVCTMGSYCAGYKNLEPSGLCAAGYYCPGGQRTPTPADYVCPHGHYCPPGSIEPAPCAPGSYQDQRGQADCKVCPAGYYCANGTHSPQPCQKGCYCGAGGLTNLTGACEEDPDVAVRNPSGFSSAPLIAVSCVAGVAILIAVATSILYIGNRLELRKIQSAKPLAGKDGHYESIREHQYEVIPPKVGIPPQMPAARGPPAQHTDIELQDLATGPGRDHRGEGAGGRERRHHARNTRGGSRDTNGGPNGRNRQSDQPRGARVPAGSPKTHDPDYDRTVFENDGESDTDVE